MAASRALLVVGPPGSGKTSLIRRFTDGTFHEAPGRTVGLDRSSPSVSLDPLQPGLPERLAALLPPEGLVVELWEMGGRPQDRQHGRGAMRPHGLLVCHDVGDPVGLCRAAHALLNHRMDWHAAHDRPALADCVPQSPRAASVLCGTKADLGGPGGAGPSAERAAEALELARAQGQCAAAVEASALTGENVATAFYALLEAVLEAEEEAEAERLAADGVPLTAGAWPLALDKPEGPPLTDPRGLRPHEPSPGAQPPAGLVEVFEGPLAEAPFGQRQVSECLRRGLWHRAVHVWLLDTRTGGLLLRRHSKQGAKHPGRWGPSCHDSIRCYAPIAGGHPPRPAVSEASADAVGRALREQLGLSQGPRWQLEMCFSCPSQASCGDGGTCRELLDVWVLRVDPHGGLVLSLRDDEEAEWVHFLDVFGPAGRAAENLFHMEPPYADAAVQRLRARVAQAGQAAA